MSNPKLKPHALCSFLMPAKEFERDVLEDSIKSIGFDPAHKILMFEGKILDGLTRYELCLKLGVEPQFEEFKGDRAAAAKHVWWEHLGRRSLSKDQRTFLVAKFRHEFNANRGRDEKMSLDEAAKIAHTTPSKMEKASSVTLRSDKMAAKGAKGEISPDVAFKQLQKNVPEKFTGDHWEQIQRTADKIKAFEEDLAKLAHEHLDPLLGMPGAEMLEAAIAHPKTEKGTGRTLIGGSLVEHLLLICRQNRPSKPCPVCNGMGCQDCGDRKYITPHEEAQQKNWRNKK